MMMIMSKDPRTSGCIRQLGGYMRYPKSPDSIEGANHVQQIVLEIYMLTKSNQVTSTDAVHSGSSCSGRY